MVTTIPSPCRTGANRNLRGTAHWLQCSTRVVVRLPSLRTATRQTYPKARPADSLPQRSRNWMRQESVFGRLACSLIAACLLITGWTMVGDIRSSGNVSVTTEIYDAGGVRTSGGAVVNDGSLGGVGGQATGGGFTITGGYPAQLVPPASPPPTAAILMAFDARWIRTGEVALAWRTGVEFGLLGFHLQRREGNGDWLDVNAGIIPSAGNGRPTPYGFVEVHVPAAGEVWYRLLAVDFSGQKHVMAETTAQVGLRAEIALTSSGLTISVLGQAGQAVVETTSDVAHGPWLPVTELRLDAEGHAVQQMPMAGTEAARFYRVRQD